MTCGRSRLRIAKPTISTASLLDRCRTWRTGDVTIFESGACLLHLARQSEKLMPHDAAGGAATQQWVIAALNSIEMVTVPWWFLQMSGQKDNGLTGWVDKRLAQLEACRISSVVLLF